MESSFVPVETILKIEDNVAAECKINNDDVPSTNLPSAPPVFVSTGTQCSVDSEPLSATANSLKDYSLIAYASSDVGKINQLININPTEHTNTQQGVQIFPKHWATADSNGQVESTAYQNAKFLLMAPNATTSQDYQHEDEFFHQFDYKTRNTIKTKQRRSNPCYRDQERSRQRTVMRIKRQDPDFREAEREKGRFRMRVKRLNPEFRKIERQRQRERMKLKRQDPSFREREREQQKNRLHEKRLDPEFREREKAQDRLRMQMKRHNSETLSSGDESKKDKNSVLNPNIYYKNNAANSPEVHLSTLIATEQTSSTPALFDSITDVKPVLLKDKVPYEPFQYRRGPVYNFHLYSNGKDQWLTPANSYSKGLPQFNVIKDDNEHQNDVASPLVQNSALYSPKQTSESPEQDDSNAQIELNVKSNISADSVTAENPAADHGLLFSDTCKTDDLAGNSLPLEQQIGS